MWSDGGWWPRRDMERRTSEERRGPTRPDPTRPEPGLRHAAGARYQGAPGTRGTTRRFAPLLSLLGFLPSRRWISRLRSSDDKRRLVSASHKYSLRTAGGMLHDASPGCTVARRGTSPRRSKSNKVDVTPAGDETPAARDGPGRSRAPRSSFDRPPSPGE